ncbi:hypothetical protein G8A07_04925 [Roseateles sp. DAIF2]|uniref:hypothetical protein n=1 Tax=Roseateles sp. DAIF2 TaxID=2714952 RepID=UPI0018A30DC2|nr:hypothetical protein [Roseateles sp. DAIF2]QPF72339.1 hypothetical protein G8A07_04925 [Roseateles sp. DAIF2]
MPPSTAQPATPDPALQVLPDGHRLDGYQLHGLLATSGSSLSYLATDLELGLAVTVMEYFPAALARRGTAGQVGAAEPAQAEAYAQGLQAFAEEARALARCQHPSLLPVQRLWHAQGTAYRISPYLDDAQPLLALRREMPGPPDEVALLALLDGLLGALAAFHRGGHLHGGVQPANILLLADDRPLLLGPDWAAAALARAATGSALTEAQAAFAPREQAALPPGSAPGAALDLYALSEVVKFCIGGELPAPAATRRLGAQGESAQALVRRRFGQDPRVRFAAPLLRTLDAASSARPQDRPADIAQFRAWLGSGPPADGHEAAAPPAPAILSEADVNAFLTPEFLAKLAQANTEEDEKTAPPPEPPPIDRLLAAQPAQTDEDRPQRPRPLPARPPRRPVRLGALAGVLGLFAVAGLGAWQSGLIDWPPRPAPQQAAAPVAPDATRQARHEADLARAEEALARSAQPAPPASAASAAEPLELPGEPTAAGRPAEALAPDEEMLPRREAAAAPARPTRTAAGPETPRAQCGQRTEFALYRCMQKQCAQPRWRQHAQCEALQQADRPH